ncbi:glycosyltransferase family 4 protein [Pelolinea submarina]|uniref:Glycosyltransferase involved in cell wall biosynthesis n=1 Tax=Pelolinea submarina TaxID=913107 RepID=A0A347ZU87_9CHLR|nr:glycosyltransferase family 4 protein [Pelolinea submarina]REG10549.1 glycosyltransferase involved in cell wall biosynthesis [Pelolinea submarina]BBB48868.1 hypothetical protein Pelsub_P2099 [Pelolinea submarina]
MKIGVAGPVSLSMLASYVHRGKDLPAGYLFSPMATWVEELLHRGHQISLFTLAPEISKPQTFTGKQLTIHIGRYRTHRRARDFFKQERQDLLDDMQDDPVDVLHAHWTYEFALAALSSGYPVLVTAHDAPWEILRLHPHPYLIMRLLMAYQVCRKASVMSVVSPYLELNYRKRMLYRGQLEVIPNPVSDALFDKPARVNRTRKVIFASVLVGWAGRKNGQVLMEAFAKVHQQYPDSELWMFGDGHGPGQAAQRWAEAHGFTQGVQFRGQTPHPELLRELSEKVDILVHPALEESFGIAIAEAMALHIPVVGGKFSGAVLNTLGEGGLLVDVRSSQEIADAMLILAKDPDLRFTLGRLGRERAKQHYSLNKTTSMYEILYQQILSNSKEKLRKDLR